MKNKPAYVNAPNKRTALKPKVIATTKAKTPANTEKAPFMHHIHAASFSNSCLMYPSVVGNGMPIRKPSGEMKAKEITNRINVE
jgi:hypothetical protein